MTTVTENEAMTALHGLLDERQRYQGWIAALEGRRGATPPHVYDRVQRDYSDRLERVMTSLAERADQLSGTIDAMTAELATLRQHESDRTDERNEAELRAAVGEFTPEDWDRRRTEIDADLERIATDRHSLETELGELQRIVAMTRDTSSNPVVSSSPTDGSAQPANSEPVQDASAADRGAFISNAVDQGSGPAPVPQEGRGSAEQPARGVGGAAEADGSTPSIDEFVAEWHPPQVRKGDGPQSGVRGVSQAGAGGTDSGVATGASGLGLTAAAGMPPEPPARTGPFTPAAMGDTRRETDKTLKCPECGAMNYATEWYCERCGGELSTF